MQDPSAGMTDKAYVLLKGVSTVRLRLKMGVLGGIYVTEYPKEINEIML